MLTSTGRIHIVLPYDGGSSILLRITKAKITLWFSFISPDHVDVDAVRFIAVRTTTLVLVTNSEHQTIAKDCKKRTIKKQKYFECKKVTVCHI